MLVNTYTTAGLCSDNQDSLYPQPDETGDNLFILADGLGGHSDGKAASALACNTLRETIRREDPASFVLGGKRKSEPELMQAFLSDAVRLVGANLWHAARERGSDMGTTLLAVLLKNDAGYCAHVGDCALFLSSDGTTPLQKVTEEHRRGRNLARSLGADQDVTPDVSAFPFNEQSVLVMGCDGFWEHVPAERTWELLQGCPPFCVAEELARAALDAGSQDNVSVIVVAGDEFAQRNAGRQIDAFPRVLHARGDDETTRRQRLGLLAFYASQANNWDVADLVKRLLEDIPEPADVWAGVRDHFPGYVQSEIDAALKPAPPPPPVEQVVAQRPGEHDLAAGGTIPSAGQDVEQATVAMPAVSETTRYEAPAAASRAGDDKSSQVSIHALIEKNMELADKNKMLEKRYSQIEAAYKELTDRVRSQDEEIESLQRQIDGYAQCVSAYNEEHSFYVMAAQDFVKQWHDPSVKEELDQRYGPDMYRRLVQRLLVLDRYYELKIQEQPEPEQSPPAQQPESQQSKSILSRFKPKGARS
jgi:PPM family protein phosphatase